MASVAELGVALYEAAKAGNVGRLAELLSGKPDQNAIEYSDPCGNTPLCIAIIHTRNDCVKMLIDAGANVHTSGYGGYAPIHWASQSSTTSTMSILLAAGADVDTCDANGCTPLMIAAMCGDYWMVRLLLDEGANIDLKDNRGETALHIATRTNRVVIIGILRDL